VNTWSYAVIALSDDPPANFAAFSTGYGDGFYGSYFGFGSNASPVCLVTDFGLIYDKQHESTTGSRKNKWLFWKK